MFKTMFVVFVAMFAVAAASQITPQHTGAYVAARADSAAQAYAFDATNKGDGSYSFSYESPEGTSFHETGAPRAQGPEGPAVTAEGGFSYRAPDGQQVALTYTADENGFHPQGSHLPTPPPIPEEILRSLEQIAQHPETNEGTYHHDNSGAYKH